MIRATKGLASALLLALIVAGAPPALLRVGRLDALTTLRWSNLLRVVDTGSLLLAALTLAGWACWFLVVATVVAEVVSVASSGRLRITIPGGGWIQPAVAALVLAAAAPLAGPAGPAMAQERAPAPVVVVRAAPSGLPAEEVRAGAAAQPRAPAPARANPAPAQPEPGEGFVLHVVEPGDDLWTLAEKHYGDGTRWRRIAQENGLDASESLLVGTRLRLTGTQGTQPSPGIPSAAAPLSARKSGPVVVEDGENLSSIAERELGDATRWPEIQAVNPGLVTDPDRIEVGWELEMPSRAGSVAEAPVGARHRTPPTSAVPRVPAEPEADTPRIDVPRASESIALSGGAELAGPVRGDASGELPAGLATSDGGGVSSPTDAVGSVAETGAVPGMELVAGMGTLLCAALAGGLAWRRRGQLAMRPPGRRMVLPGGDALAFEAALARAAVDAPAPPPEAGVAMVLLGEGEEGPVMLDLEQARTTLVVGPEGLVDDAVAAVVTGLPLQPWSLDARVVVVGDLPWIRALDEAQVTVLRDRTAGLAHLGRAVTARRAALAGEAVSGEGSSLEQLRSDPDRWDAWAPQVYVLAERLPAGEWEEVVRMLAGTPTGISVLAVGDDPAGAQRLVCSGAATPSANTPAGDAHAVPQPGETFELISATRARLRGRGDEFAPSLLPQHARQALAELLETSSAARTTPAPWWTSDDDLPPNLTVLERHRTTVPHDEEAAVDPTACTHPTLLLLGPVELHGCQGEPPNRARRQCIEYAAWIHQHPGGTATTMSRQLLVAEGTRRSNMSRLRNWLGSDANGELYLPDAYSGRIQLHPDVTTDWEHLQLLVATGINRARTDTLVEALQMVRGAPLADAAPGQWHWAEELRTDMVSVVRDIGVVLVGRALDEHDVDLARWAASRALKACPGDELLSCARIRTEHRAGNRPEVERLVLQLTRWSRTVGIDLADETICLMQEVMEGRARAQQA